MMRGSGPSKVWGQVNFSVGVQSPIEREKGRERERDSENMFGGVFYLV